MKNMWKIAFLGLICGVFHNWSTVFGENSALLKEFLLKGLEENLSRLDTAECRYNYEVFDAMGSYAKEISWKYDFKDKKEYMKIVLYDQPPDKILNVIEVSLNYKKETGIEIRKHREAIKFTGKPASGRILDKGHTLSYTNSGGLLIDIPPSSFFSTLPPEGLSIKEILMDPNTQVLPQKEYVENDACYVIYLPKSSKILPQDADLFTKMRYAFGYKIWLCPEKGYLPRKMEIFGPDPRRPFYIYIINHKKFEQDIWFPVQFIHSSGLVEPGKKFIVEYKNIRINQPLDNAVFDLKFPPGTEVYDEITGVSFTVPER